MQDMIKHDEQIKRNEVTATNSPSSEAEIFKQKLEQRSIPSQSEQNKADDDVPAIQPLDLDGVKSQQQFYDAIWTSLGDLNGWLETMETSLGHLNI